MPRLGCRIRTKPICTGTLVQRVYEPPSTRWRILRILASTAGSQEGPGRVLLTCPVPTCRNQAYDIIKHCNAHHKGEKFTQEQAAEVGLVSCQTCQKLLKARGLSRHYASAPACGRGRERTSRRRAPERPGRQAPAPRELYTSLEVKQRYEALRNLPGLPCLRVPVHLVKVVKETVDRLSKNYLEKTNEEALMDLLAFPKVALAPALKMHTVPARDHIAAYPNVLLPRCRTSRRRQKGAVEGAMHALQRGRISRAARCITENSGVAEITPEVIEQLQALHPDGPANPFEGDCRPAKPMNLDTQDVDWSVSKMAEDTSGGIAGWTLPLFRLVFEGESTFSKFFLHLLHESANGLAPGRDVLTASSLTPLIKPNGKIRPIAVGELFYRIICKSILDVSFKKEMLLPGQYGVKSKGGVEPIIRLAQQAKAGHLVAEYDTILQLDCKNAFNTINRRHMAKAIAEYAPDLYRLAKWAYNTPSPLYIPGVSAPLHSSEGVRQGDPLGPLFFSLAYRRKLDKLQEALGDDCLVVAYLDDTYIFSLGSVKQQVFRFFEENSDDGIQLNEEKCKEHDLMEEEGFEMLGGFVGEDPEEFSEKHIQEEKVLLMKLLDLPAQGALLLLRKSFQLRLRHLLRTLPCNESLLSHWRHYDDALRFNLLLWRGKQQEELPLDHILCKLPVTLGGLGLASHADIAPHASIACIQSSDCVLEERVSHYVSEDHGKIIPQKDRCYKMYLDQHKQLAATLEGRELCQWFDLQNSIAPGWLNVRPFDKYSTLSNDEVAYGLSQHTLTQGSQRLCPDCLRENYLGHHECCTKKERTHTYRHENWKGSISWHVQTIPGTEVRTEPRYHWAEDDGSRTDGRTDLHIEGEGSYQQEKSDYDVSITSIHARAFKRPAGNQSRAEFDAEARRYLEDLAQFKRSKYSRVNTGAFHPIIATANGTLSASTKNLFAFWLDKLPTSGNESLLESLSVGLVRAGARSFVF